MADDVDPFELAKGMKMDLLAAEAQLPSPSTPLTNLHAKMVTAVVYLVGEGILTEEQGDELIGRPGSATGLKGAHTNDGGTGKGNPPPPNP